MKSETLRIVDPLLILDLRKRTERSHYYESGAMFTNGKRCTFMSLEIETGKSYLDTGRAVKDKHATIKRTCQQLVEMIKGGSSVLIVCYDGMSTSGYLAMIVRWWYGAIGSGTSATFDCATLVKEARNANDFNSAKSKDQLAQMEAVRLEALKIMGWENRGFVLTKRQKVEPTANDGDEEEEEEENSEKE